MNIKKLGEAIKLDTNIPPCSGFAKGKTYSYALIDFELENTDFLEKSAAAYCKTARLIWGDSCFFGYNYKFSAKIIDRFEDQPEVYIKFVATPYVTDDEWEDMMGGPVCQHFRLSSKEQRLVFKLLDEQCKAFFKRSCAEILESERERMESVN